MIIQRVKPPSLWSKGNAERLQAIWKVSAHWFTPSPRCLVKLPAQLLSESARKSAAAAGNILPAPAPPRIAKPVDFTIATERTELGNVIQGDDHLTYPINGFQINLL